MATHVDAEEETLTPRSYYWQVLAPGGLPLIGVRAHTVLSHPALLPPKGWSMRAIAPRELLRLRYTNAWKLDGEKIAWAGGPNPL